MDRRKHFSFFLASPAVIWQLLFLCIPFIVIVGLSFLLVTDQATVFTLSHYTYFFAFPFFKIIVRSFVLAFTTTLLCFVFAYPVAYYLAFFVKKFKTLLLFFLLLPFWTSLLVLAYSWFFILENYGLLNIALMKLGIISSPLMLLNTPFAVYLVMLYCYMPFMIIPVYTSLEKMDKRLVEASLDTGATSLQTFWYITFPLSLSSVRTGFFLVFIPAFGEFVIPGLLGGDKEFFVGSLISHYFLVTRNQYLGSAFTCISGLLLAVVMYLVYKVFNSFVYVTDTDKEFLYEKE